MGFVDLPRRTFKVADIERMLEVGVLDHDEKFELIRGEIVPMNAQYSSHFILKSRIARWMFANLPASLETYVEPTVSLSGEQLFEPDLAICPPQPIGRRFLDVRVIALAIEIAGASLRRDRDVKAPEYAAAGLPELWIVDIEAQETLRMRAPSSEGYSEVIPVPFKASLAPLCAPEAARTVAALLA